MRPSGQWDLGVSSSTKMTTFSATLRSNVCHLNLHEMVGKYSHEERIQNACALHVIPMVRIISIRFIKSVGWQSNIESQ